RAQIDWIVCGLFLALVAIGWFMIYSAGRSSGEFYPFDLSTPAGKQFIWVIISIGVLLILQFLDYRFWESFSLVFYIMGIVLLIAVLIFGTEIKGSLSWFTIGGISFQPSEFAKFGTALGLASYLSDYKTKITTWQDRMMAI